MMSISTFSDGSMRHTHFAHDFAANAAARFGHSKSTAPNNLSDAAIATAKPITAPIAIGCTFDCDESVKSLPRFDHEAIAIMARNETQILSTRQEV